jgi:hypothetical protein
MLLSRVNRGGGSMAGFVQGVDREQVTLFPAREFVACPGKCPEPHPLEAMVSFQMREAHLDTLSFVSRFGGPQRQVYQRLPSQSVCGGSKGRLSGLSP